MKVRYERTAFYYETDQMAIIHHANYIRWMEEARIFAMQQVGIDYAVMEQEGVQIPVLGVECTYRSMVRFGDTVYIDAWVEEYDGVRLVIGYTITDKKTGELRTTARSWHCFLASASGRPVSLKRRMPAMHERFLRFLEPEQGEG